MQNLREYLKQGNPDGEYHWDYMDGLDEVPKEYQEKFKTAVIQGKIADEDWRGVRFKLGPFLHAYRSSRAQDPAFNELGQKGTQPRAKKVKKPAEGEDDVGISLLPQVIYHANAF